MSLRATGIASSSSRSSHSRALVERTLSHLAMAGAATTVIDLLDLPADALLGRRRDPAVDAAIADALAAPVLVLGTPVYRATYSGQLKAFLDLFPQDALRGHAVGLIVTGQAEAHQLAVDHGLRPLVASLGGIAASNGVYVTNALLPDPAAVPEEIDRTLRVLAAELLALAAAVVPARVPA